MFLRTHTPCGRAGKEYGCCGGSGNQDYAAVPHNHFWLCADGLVPDGRWDVGTRVLAHFVLQPPDAHPLVLGRLQDPDDLPSQCWGSDWGWSFTTRHASST